MLIAIDASRAVNESAGIGRYTLELVKKIIDIDKKNEYILFFSYGRKSSQKEKIIKSFKQSNVEIKTWIIPGNLKEKVWGWKLPWFGRFLKGVDLFYAPSFFEVNLGLNIPQIVTICDLTTFLFPKHRGEKVSQRLNLRVKQVCKKAKKIIAISQSTKNDITNILKISSEKIEVIYPGNKTFNSPACGANTLPKNLKSKKYILTVGTIEPRKNLTGLFKAYSLLPIKLQEEYPLVVVGAKGWNIGEIFDCIKYLKLEGRIKFLGFTSDNILAKLYKEAAIFVYPSLYEGFGFPVLEAMSFGTPVVTSKISSLPEVVGGSGILINPEIPKSITSAMQRLLEHSELADELGKKGVIQAKKFTWEKTARQTLEVFEKIQNPNV